MASQSDQIRDLRGGKVSTEERDWPARDIEMSP
jgi:hypothetical protein